MGGTQDLEIIYMLYLIRVQGMSKFIARSFENEETFGTHVEQGYYYMKTPSGDIILPLAWEDTIQPSWFLIMQLWPESCVDHKAAPIAPDHPLLHPSRPL